MKSIRLHPSLGQVVIDRLKELTLLPDKGIIAGQAVASVIDHLRGLNASPINDVDVFRIAGNYRLQRSEQSIVNTVQQQKITTIDPSLAYPALAEYLRQTRSYRVSSVSRQGLVNYVNCHVGGSPLNQDLSAAKVIHSFDLNCVRVAVDLTTRQLVWDRHFENFCRTRRLEICAVHTPWHTFLRALKKQGELPEITLDVEAVATVVAAFYYGKLYRDFERCGSLSDVFGPKLLSLAWQLQSQWLPYFDLQLEDLPCATREDGSVSIASLRPRGMVDERIQQRANNLHNAAIHLVGPQIHAYFNKPTHRVASRVAELENLLSKRHVLLQQHFEADAVGLAAGQVSERQLDDVTLFLNEHAEFSGVFVGLTLAEQSEAAKVLKAYQPLLTRFQFARVGLTAAPADLRSKRAIDSLVARVKLQVTSPLNKHGLVMTEPLASLVSTRTHVQELRSIEDFVSSTHYAEDSKELLRVREGNLAIVEVRTLVEGKEFATALEFDLSERKALKLSLVRKPSREVLLPIEHEIIKASVIGRILPDASFQPAEESYFDDPPF